MRGEGRTNAIASISLYIIIKSLSAYQLSLIIFSQVVHSARVSPLNSMPPSPCSICLILSALSVTHHSFLLITVFGYSLNPLIIIHFIITPIILISSDHSDHLCPRDHCFHSFYNLPPYPRMTFSDTSPFSPKRCAIVGAGACGLPCAR